MVWQKLLDTFYENAYIEKLFLTVHPGLVMNTNFFLIGLDCL